MNTYHYYGVKCETHIKKLWKIGYIEMSKQVYFTIG